MELKTVILSYRLYRKVNRAVLRRGDMLIYIYMVATLAEAHEYL